MILPVYNSVSRIDKDLINAAMDLGAGYRETFFRVIWPLSLPGVISGITMVFVPSLTTFVISDVLGGGKISAIPTIAGIGTIITAFFMGPLIEFFNIHITRPFLAK